LQDYAGVIGLGEAVKYLSQFDFEDIKKHELALNSHLTKELSKFPEIKIIGPTDPSLRGGIFNFYLEGKDMHQISVMLDEMTNIAVRSGQHCFHSWFHAKGIRNSLRVSLYFYNTLEEIEIFINTLTKILKVI